MSRKSLVFVPTSAALVDQTLHTDSGTDTDTACSRQWKKTKSSGVARGNEFIASSRVHPKPEGSEEESGRNIEAGTAPPSTVCAGATMIATAVTTTAEDLPEKKEEEEEAEASLDFCEVESDNVHAQAPLLFHYRGVQREYALHKEGPSDISEIFSRAISIMNDSDSASSHSLISVLDSQQGNGSGSGSGSGSGNNNNGNGLPKEKVLETRLIQVCIPEHKVVKMTVFSPLQTIGSFVGTLLDSISKGEEPEDYQMVFPIFLSDSISAFTLDSRSAFGIYGIGMKADEVPPTLFLFRRTRDNIYDLPKYESFVGLKASSQEDVRADAWLKVLTNWSALTPGPLTLSLVRETITKMAVAGIPAGVRGWAWRQVSGCFTIANENPGLYADLLAQALQSPPPYMRRINVDLARSLPRHPFFASKDSFGQPALKRVLLAFGQYERSIGYCQGINFIAAALLCYMDEEV